MRSRLFLKLYTGFALVIVLGGLAAWFLTSGRARRRALAQVEASLITRAVLLRESIPVDLDAPGSPPLQALVDRLGDAAGTRLTLIREDGVVLGDSWEEPARMNNHSGRPEIVQARETREPGSSRRYSRTVERDMMYVAVPVLDGRRISGYARAAVPLDIVEQRLVDVGAGVALGAVLAAVIALLLGAVLTRIFTRPLTRMTDMARAIAAGDYSRRGEFTADDEIGELGRAIQRMSAQLDERMRALSREGDEVRAVLGGMREGVVAVDADGRVVQLNEAAARILSVDRDDSIGTGIREFTGIPEVSEIVSGVLADGGDRKVEVRQPGGRTGRILELRASPLGDPEDAPRGAIVVLHDVTELRRLEVVRREFVANVSHELKTPLTAIRGYVETLLDDEEIERETRIRFLGRLRDQTLQITTLVSDLLVLSRVESEEEAIERRRIDLRQPVIEFAERLAPDATGRSLRFDTHLPESPVPVVGDEEALRQVVDNLLDNAFKYTPDEGRVELRVAEREHEAVITVRDTGPGMERKHLDRIFERFYRVDKARSRELGGTGLGLSIVKHIVEAHGGRVTVESEPDRGSTFQVILPLCEAVLSRPASCPRDGGG